MANLKFLSRRGFLKGTAGIAVALPLLESIGAGPLRAESAPRKRFLSFHCSSGVTPGRFRPPIGPITSESLQGYGMEPLSAYANRLLVPRGVHGYPVGTYTSHSQGTGQALTAARIARGGGGLADGASSCARAGKTSVCRCSIPSRTPARASSSPPSQTLCEPIAP
jgi:hypothetical protein